jgi:hypothetical protein
MGWKDKLAAKAADAAKSGIEMARDKVENEHAASRAKALRDMRDEQPITIEALLVLLVDAVHEDNPRELSKRDVKKAGKRRQRLAGGLGMFGGPVGMYTASLYCEAEILCDVADRHRLPLSDEDLAAHLLVMWNAMPDFPSAKAAVDGTGESVAARMAAHVQGNVAQKPLDQMTKRDAVLALWRLRGALTETSLPGSARARDVFLAGSRVKAVTQAAERQLAVAPERGGLFRRRAEVSLLNTHQPRDNGAPSVEQEFEAQRS